MKHGAEPDGASIWCIGARNVGPYVLDLAWPLRSSFSRKRKVDGLHAKLVDLALKLMIPSTQTVSLRREFLKSVMMR